MKHLISLFFLITSFCSYAQPDTIVVRDLKLDWKTVDAEGKLDNIDLESSEIILFGIPENTGQLLKISTTSSVDFWINDQLVTHNFIGSKVFRINELRKKYGTLERLSIYQKGGISDVTTQLIEVTNQRILWNPVPRSFSELEQLFLLQLLFLLFMSAIFYRIDSEIFKGYQSLLRIRKSGLDDTTELYTQTSVLKMIFLSVLIAISMSYFQLNVIRVEPNSLADGLVATGLNVVFVFILLLIKQFYALLLSKLYGFKRATILHLNGYSNLMMIAFIICLFLLLFDFCFATTSYSQFKWAAIFTITVAIVLIQLWTFLKLDNQYTEKKLMIFTYLCTTEMAPGFLVLFWLDKIG
ncbi:MAG: DUF4271 domain-containing protein [Cyclobacteriaceae bacterium]